LVVVCLVFWPALCCILAARDSHKEWDHRCSNCRQLVATRMENGAIIFKLSRETVAVPSKYGAAGVVEPPRLTGPNEDWKAKYMKIPAAPTNKV
jgi:hypothetical protein